MEKLDYKLITNRNGYVGFYLVSGKHKIHDLTTVKTALSIIKDGKELIESNKIAGFPLCVDNKYYFEAIIKTQK